MLAQPNMPQILVVTDDANVRDPLAAACEAAGWLMRFAESGDAAELVLAIESALFDGLVIDLEIGESGAGIEVARQVRTRLPDLPFIYLTHAWPGSAARVSVAGGAIFAKPFEAATLLTSLGAIIKRRQISSR